MVIVGIIYNVAHKHLFPLIGVRAP